MTKRIDLTNGVQANRTMEFMTKNGTVYATAGEIEKHDDGTISQEITISGGIVIGRVARLGADEFLPENTLGEYGDAVNTMRNAVAIIVQEFAEDEAAETEAAARGLLSAVARKAAAEKAATRAADAAGYARQAAAEATDAAREAGRLALMIRPDADPAEVQDVAQAAQAAATAAARSAGLARANAELAADRAAEAVAVAEDAQTEAEDAAIRFHAGQAVAVEKYDARGLSYYVCGVVARDAPMDHEDVFILIGGTHDWFNHAAVTAE